MKTLCLVVKMLTGLERLEPENYDDYNINLYDDYNKFNLYEIDR